VIAHLSSFLGDTLPLPAVAPFADPLTKLGHTVTRVLSLAESGITYGYIFWYKCYGGSQLWVTALSVNGHGVVRIRFSQINHCFSY